MKKIFISLILLFVSVLCFSQDIIFYKTGEELNVKVIEVLPESIKYKKVSNIEGPTYTELKNNIFMIKYENGDKDVFTKSSESSNKSDATLKKKEVVTERKKEEKNISGGLVLARKRNSSVNPVEISLVHKTTLNRYVYIVEYDIFDVRLSLPIGGYTLEICNKKLNINITEKDDLFIEFRSKGKDYCADFQKMDSKYALLSKGYFSSENNLKPHQTKVFVYMPHYIDTLNPMKRSTMRSERYYEHYVHQYNRYLSEELASKPEYEFSTFIDARDQREYRTLFVRATRGDTWMAEDLQFKKRKYKLEEALEACPEGWHLPSSYEWFKLIGAFGGFARAKDKLTSKDYFNGAPDILIDPWTNEVMQIRGKVWWSSSIESEFSKKTKVWVYSLFDNTEEVLKTSDGAYNSKIKYCVRCVKDKE